MDKEYEVDTPENRAFLEANAAGLLDFGRRFPSPGGSAYYLHDDGTPWVEKPRETYETARMAHSYALGELRGREGSGELVDAALRGLDELEDKTNGGWYSGMTANNEPYEGKETYANAFVILAASSALLAGHPQARDILSRAISVFDDKFWDDHEGLTVDRWDTAFENLDPYRGLNANMHTVEAYLAAADALDDQQLRDRAGRIIQRVIPIAAKNEYRIPEHFNAEWEPELEYNADKKDDQFRPYGATPGHGFEWARLTLQWALSEKKRNPELSAKYVAEAERLFDRAAADGWNADGAPGIVYTTDWDGNPVVHDRMHWTLAEAIGAAAALWHATGDQKYADWYTKFMEYLEASVMDHVNGSWFHQLDEHNEPTDTVWPGKPDIYHALQASLIPLYAPDLSIASAVARDNAND